MKLRHHDDYSPPTSTPVTTHHPLLLLQLLTIHFHSCNYSPPTSTPVTTHHPLLVLHLLTTQFHSRNYSPPTSTQWAHLAWVQWIWNCKMLTEKKSSICNYKQRDSALCRMLIVHKKVSALSVGCHLHCICTVTSNVLSCLTAQTQIPMQTTDINSRGMKTRIQRT